MPILVIKCKAYFINLVFAKGMNLGTKEGFQSWTHSHLP